MTDVNTGQICNSSCIMCTTIRNEDKKVKQTTISKEDIIAMIDSDKNQEYFAITGGEPTIRDDLLEIIDHIKKKYPDKEIKLLTNGRRLFYQGYSRKIASSGVDKIIIPLHAHEATLHDFISRADGSFEQTIKGIHNISKYNVPIEIRVVIHGINYPFIPEIAELINNELGNVSVVFLYFDIIGSAYLNREKLVVPMTKVAGYLEKGIDTLRDKEVSLYHFPLCTINKKYRKHAKGKTVEDRRIIFVKECNSCKEKDKCCGIWKTYNKIQGNEEFKAIR